MFHNNPKLLVAFFIIMPGAVVLFSSLGWGTNGLLFAILVTAGGLALVNWLLKRMARSFPNRETMFTYMMTGHATPSNALVPVSPRYPQHYRQRHDATVVTEVEEEFDEEEFDEEEFDEEEFDEEEFDEEEFDEEEFDEEDRHAGQRGREQIAAHSVSQQRGQSPYLRLAHNLAPHADSIFSGRVSIFGISGSGKSNLVGVLCEEYGRLLLPFVLADTEDEYSPLVDTRRTWLPNGYTAGSPNAFTDGIQPPPHYIPVDQGGAYYFGRMVLERGWQVVLNLESYDSEEEAALVMIEIIRGMRTWEQEQPLLDRVSCMFILEEAAKWLPQNTRESSLTSATLASFQGTIFNKVVRQGRKRGIGFTFATQRVAEIDKRAMQSSWKFLLWQTESVDLDRYEEMCPSIDRERVQRFIAGEVVVMGPGQALHTRIRQRSSPHGAHTPGLASVQRRYGARTRQRYYTQDLTQFTAAAQTALGSSQQAAGTATLPTRSQERVQQNTEDERGKVVQLHPTQQPQPNTEQQLAWGCAVLHYLTELREPFTTTAIRRPRRELREMALALGVLKGGSDEIVGGGSRAERIKSEVEGIAAPRMLELLRVATQAQGSYQAATPVMEHQAQSS